MRACLQRMLRASVVVLDAGETRREAGRIDGGLLALVGFAPSDGPEQLDWMAAKFADLRLFGVDGGSGFDRSLRETRGGLLLVTVVLKEKLPKYAEQLRQTATAPAFERANAAYVSKDYAQAEQLAIEAADEARTASPPRTAEAIDALALAGSFWQGKRFPRYSAASRYASCWSQTRTSGRCVARPQPPAHTPSRRRRHCPATYGTRTAVRRCCGPSTHVR